MQKIASLIMCLFMLCLTGVAETSHSMTLVGELVQGAMIKGRVPKGSRVFIGNQSLKVSSSGLFVFGLDRDNTEQEQLKVILLSGETQLQTLRIKPRDYKIQAIIGVAKKFTAQKSAETRARISGEYRAVKKARAQHFEHLSFNEHFKWPLIGPITGVFGSQRVYNGVPGRPHYGVDIAAKIGTPLYAPASGTVTLAYNDMYYSGGTVIVDHGYGISSSFLHLSKVRVSVGDELKQGDVMGEVGAGGRATGPHLDWRMNWYERRIDPQLLVPDMNKRLPADKSPDE